MPTYTGPIPPSPGLQADAATWTNWWSYQTILQNHRYEDERVARAIVTDRQHTEKMAAEAACAEATSRLAAAQVEVARLMILPTPETRRSDESLVANLAMELRTGTPGTTDAASISAAQSFVRKFRFIYPT
jgi:hypothetical protein